MPTKAKPKARKTKVATKTEIVTTDLHELLRDKFYLADITIADRAIRKARSFLKLEVAEVAFAMRELLLEARLGSDLLGYNRKLKEQFWQAEKIDLFSCHDVSRAKNLVDCELDANEEKAEQEKYRRIGEIFSDDATNKEFYEKHGIDRHARKNYYTLEAREKYATIYATISLWDRDLRELADSTDAIISEYAAEKLLNPLLEFTILFASFTYSKSYDGQKWFRYAPSRLLEGADSFSASVLIMHFWNYVRSDDVSKNDKAIFSMTLMEYLGRPALPKLIRYNQTAIMQHIVDLAVQDDSYNGLIYGGWQMLLSGAKNFSLSSNRKQEILGMLLEVYSSRPKAFTKKDRADFCKQVVLQLAEMNDADLGKKQNELLLNSLADATACIFADEELDQKTLKGLAEEIRNALDFSTKSNGREIVSGYWRDMLSNYKSPPLTEEVGTTSSVSDGDKAETRLSEREKIEFLKKCPPQFDMELAKLIVSAESIKRDEVRYWMELAPIMTPEQKANLTRILKNEHDTLAELDVKRKHDPKDLSDIELWSEIREQEKLLANFYFWLDPKDSGDGPNSYRPAVKIDSPPDSTSTPSTQPSISNNSALSCADPATTQPAKVTSDAAKSDSAEPAALTDDERQFTSCDPKELGEIFQGNLLELSSPKTTRGSLFVASALYEHLELDRTVIFLTSTRYTFAEIFFRTDEKMRSKISMASFDEGFLEEKSLPGFNPIAGQTFGERMPRLELLFNACAEIAGHQISPATQKWLVYVDRLLEPFSLAQQNGTNLIHLLACACVPQNILISWQRANTPERLRFPDEIPSPTQEVLEEIKKIACYLYCGSEEDMSRTKNLPFCMVSGENDLLDYGIERKNLFLLLPNNAFQKRIIIGGILSRIHDVAKNQQLKASIYIEESLDFIQRFGHENLSFRFESNPKVHFGHRQPQFNSYQPDSKEKLTLHSDLDQKVFEITHMSSGVHKRSFALTSDREPHSPKCINAGYFAQKFCIDTAETKKLFSNYHKYLRPETAQEEFKKTRVKEMLISAAQGSADVNLPKSESKTSSSNEPQPVKNEVLHNLAANLQSQVIAQADAINTLAQSVRSSAVGLKINPRRPNGVFLFLGPTGTGKTELAKALARELFGSEDAMIRFDMSEFQERHTVGKLIGSPVGYLGSDRGGKLTEAVKKQPHSVVLLDEIEKAHHNIYSLFLQVFDDGRLTDGLGETVDFRHTYIIMTSNIGNNLKNCPVGFSTTDYENKRVSHDEIITELKKVFSPELIGRLDEVCFFDRLNDAELHQVASLKIGQAAKNLSENGHAIEFAPNVTDFVLKKALARGGREFVTRELGKTISREIITPLTDWVIQNGKQRLSVKTVGGKVKIEESAANEAAESDKNSACESEGESIVTERIADADEAVGAKTNNKTF